MQYAIDMHIPIPTQVKKDVTPKVDRYPHAKMEVGDSFLIPAGTRGSTLGNVCAMNRKAGTALGMKFIARSVEGGIRVWRKE